MELVPGPAFNTINPKPTDELKELSPVIPGGLRPITVLYELIL